MLRTAAFASNARAIGWVAVGTALFSLIYASGKFADGAASPFQILFLRYVGGSMTLLLLAALGRRRWSDYRSARPFSHLVRALFGASGGGALIHASATMPIVDATAIGLLYVVFVIPLGVWVLHERLTGRHLIAIAACCAGAGVVMASRGAFTRFEPTYLLPAGIAILGAALLALEGLMIRMLAQADRAMTVLLYVNAFGILLMALPAAVLWMPVSAAEIAAFALLGPIAVTAQYCIVQGYRLAPLSIVGPVDYTWLVFAGLIGFMVFDETMTAGVVVGSLVIVAGGTILAGVKTTAGEQPKLAGLGKADTQEP